MAITWAFAVHRCIETKCILRLFPHKISIFPRFYKKDCRVALLRPIGDSEFPLKYQCIMMHMANKKYVSDHYSVPASSLTPTRPREFACRL